MTKFCQASTTTLAMRFLVRHELALDVHYLAHGISGEQQSSVANKAMVLSSHMIGTQWFAYSHGCMMGVNSVPAFDVSNRYGHKSNMRVLLSDKCSCHGAYRVRSHPSACCLQIYFLPRWFCLLLKRRGNPKLLVSRPFESCQIRIDQPERF